MSPLDPILAAVYDRQRVLGWSVRYLAAAAGIAHSTAYEALAGRRVPSVWVARQMAEAVGLRIVVELCGPSCGTAGGARRHRRLGEVTCPACREACRRVKAAWRAKQRARGLPS